MNDYTLKTQITAIGGDTIATLHFDWDGMGLSQYRQILSLESRLRTTGPAQVQFDVSIGKKTSSEFRIAAAWVAAVRGTKGLCIDDIERVGILDLLELETEGLLFFGGLA